MINEFLIDENNNININLRENILLEASAGTGKTYSLERVVLNLIKNPTYGLTIKDILVVTFTNKATREMKERIRTILIEEYRKEENPILRHRLENAIGDFDEASIFTIHGFCQNTLQSFPFESLSLFSQEINQDDNLLKSAVWDFLREFETTSDEINLKEFYAFRANKNFSTLVDELMGLYNRDEFRGGSTFFPGSVESQYIYNLRDDYNNKTGDLYNIIPLLKSYNPDMLLEASKAMGCATRITSFEKVFNGFSSIELEGGFEDFLDKLYSAGFIENLVKLTSSFLEKKSKKGLTINDIEQNLKLIVLNIEHFLSYLEPLYDGYNFTKNPYNLFLAGEFIKKALGGIDSNFKKRQEKQGVLSYNDLIENLHNRIIDGDDSLLKAIQNRYKIALIDEFQDTDNKQWNIFNKIFGNSPKHNFLLIGDPKQSIYGFRGADLEIYYKAKKSVLEQNQYFLGRNFRSEDGIVKGINQIFTAVFDVKTKGYTAPTSFNSVKSCGKPEKNIGGNNHNIEFLLFDTLSEKDELIKSNKCKIGYFKTVVTKILELLNSESTKVKPSDIAILVESHKDSIFLRDALLKKSVPVVISRQKNVYKSHEAKDILNLLRALNRPGGNGEIKTLLLSPIFGYDLKEIHDLETSGEFEIISSKLLNWSQRLQHSGIITIWNEIESYSKKGELQTRILSTLNGERIYTNFKHLIENLNILQKSERLNSFGLYQKLHSFMESATEDEENSVRLDRDTWAVQIMTIHASKGLEFPVVFFAGGFGGSQSRNSGYGIKYANKSGVWTYDFLNREESKILSERDQWEEKKRLYYVAFTRAASKLYLPIFKNSELMTLSSLYASLKWDENRLKIEEIVGDKLISNEQPIHKQLKIDDAKLNKKLKLDLSKKIYEDIDSLFYIDRESYLIKSVDNYKYNNTITGLALKEIKNSGFRNRVTWVSSYSALTKDSHGSISKEDADRDDEEESITPEYVKSDILNTFNIPGGANYGDFIHEFFEEIDFNKHLLPLNEFLEEEDINNLYINIGKKHFDLDWIKKSSTVVKTTIWNTLNSKLNLNGELKAVGAFNSQNRIHEREFYFRVDRSVKIDTHGLELKFEEGFVKGFIDLIINHNGTLYIADWKSTTIKGDENYDNYSADRIEKSMDEHNYHLQGLIYTVALYKHLKKTKKEFDYNRDIGGYFYLYVRGMSPEYNSGICFNKPKEEEVLEFINKLRSNL